MSESESDEDAPAAPIDTLLTKLLGSKGAESDLSDAEDDAPPPSIVAAPESAVSPSAVMKTSAVTMTADHGTVTTLSLKHDQMGLPSALGALDAATKAKPDFLHVEGPEFDASKNFRPPPISALDLLPITSGALGSSAPRPFADASEVQRYDPEFNFGRTDGSVRLRGSVCHEKDDERGRRVRYGAAAMMKADPWSDCNPNFEMRGKRKR